MYGKSWRVAAVLLVGGLLVGSIALGSWGGKKEAVRRTGGETHVGETRERVPEARGVAPVRVSAPREASASQPVADPDEDDGDSPSLTWAQPTARQKSRYRAIRLQAKTIGVELPRKVEGSVALWDDIDRVSDSFERELFLAASKWDRRLHEVALTRAPNQRKRIGDAGERQRVSGASARTVFLTNVDGVFEVSVLPGEDGEVDRLEGKLRDLRSACADAMVHVLRSRGVLK